MEWKEWIARKYLEWRGDKIGSDGSISAFSRWLGVSQKTVNSWINEGVVPRSASTINLLVARFGGEVYDVLDLRPPAEPLDPDLRELHLLNELLKQIPPEKFDDLALVIRAWALDQGITIVDSDKKE